jgi:peptidoglycan/xylan/chitin deacetylase (PgdA/CDA1 family)
MEIRFLFLVTAMAFPMNLQSQTTILKWPEGKQACVTFTYDDGTLNQFEIAVPLMDKHNFKGTFFINTEVFGGSENYATFVGRPITDILNESKTVSTNNENVLERTSMIRYLREIQKVPEIRSFDMYEIGSNLERGRYAEVFSTVDEICKILVESKKTYEVLDGQRSANMEVTTWNDLKRIAENGHEFANHTISHPHLSTMDRANILYELTKCKEDLSNFLGPEHTLSLECPYGIHDERVMEIAFEESTFLRNHVPEDYFDEILRSNPRPPGKSEKEYIHWQRGPLSDTPYTTMTAWIDTSIHYNIWLVLVIHGIEGIGWEPLPAQRISDYFRYVKNKENAIWIASFQDAYKYIRERMNCRISESVSREEIMLTLECPLEPETVYNMPLTLKTPVPDEWEMVKIVQNNNIQRKKPVEEENKKFVIYNACPGAYHVSLTNAND